MKKILYTISLCAAFVLLTACPKVEPEPTPEPVPTPDVNVSLGQISLITGEKMIPESARNLVVQQMDGSYAFVCKNSPYTLNYVFMKDYDPAHPFNRYVNFPIAYDFKLGSKPAVPANAPDVIDLTSLIPSVINLGNRSKGETIYLSGLPEGILSIEEIHLTEDSYVELKLSITDPFFTEGSVIPEFSVNMGKFIDSPEAVNGVISFDAELTPKNGYKVTKVFHLNSVPLDPENYNAAQKKLKLNAVVGLSGKVKCKNLKTTKSRLSAAGNEILLNASVVLRQVKIESITGRFEGSAQSVTKTVGVNATVAAMELDAAASAVQLDVESDITAPSQNLVAVSTRKSRKAIGTVADIPLPLDPATQSGIVKASFMLNEIADLSSLFTKMPDEFVFSTAVSTLNDQSCTIKIGQENHVSLTPTITIPFKPAKSFLLEKTDTIAVQSNVGTALKSKALELNGELVNTLPLDVEIIVTLIDNSGNVLSQAVSQSFPAGTTSQIKQTIRAVGSTPENISKAVIVSRLHGIDNGRVIKPDDKLQATMNIKIPGDK